MIIHRRWTKIVSDISSADGKRKAFIEGWFLFGILPIFIRDVDPHFF